MLYIKYPSALEFWLVGTGMGDVKFPYVMRNFSPEAAESTWNGKLKLSTPVSIMVESAKRRRSNSRFKCFAKPKYLPENAFVQVANNVCVESPEMCFLEAAKDLKFPYLVELGNCLCSGYVYDENAKYSQRSRTPVTNRKKIADFLNCADRCDGVRLARRAVKYVQNCSGSPLESKISVIFFIPLRDGGFALKPGVLNGLIRLTSKAEGILKYAACRTDILWEQDMLAFEYDSEMTHANDNQRQYDARRRMAIEQSGYKLITFTNDTLKTFDDFEKATMVIREALNMKSRPVELEKHRSRRMQTFIQLFKTPHSFVRP